MMKYSKEAIIVWFIGYRWI